MVQYMLDTDISSYIMKRSNANVLQRLSNVAVVSVCISAITHSELMFGVVSSPRRKAGLTLVTNNTREFSRVAGLLVGNWTI